MPPRPPPVAIDALVQRELEDAVQRAVQDIARAISGMAAEELSRRLEKGAVRPGQVLPPARRRRPRGEMTRWTADRRARRVPTFVIELTGLTTKKQIVARYGADAAFEKGKPAPRARG